MTKRQVPKELVGLIENLPSKRARIVIEHILEHGFITTEDLEKGYGYNHPPRAARDVREAGIPLETFKTTSTGGRRIAAYRLGDLTELRKARLKGRRQFSKKFKAQLYEAIEGKCALCAGRFESRYLQVDHRVPYEVSGNEVALEPYANDYTLLCGSCNRAKSWSCEHCQNWLSAKSAAICSKCYWACPDDYLHIALREVRRLDLVWDQREITVYERLKKEAEQAGERVPDYVKRIIAGHLGRKEC